MARKPPQYVQTLLAKASQEHGIPYSVLRSFAEIESTFRPGARTGSYNGLFMLSREEFKRGGGKKGQIMNPEANTNAFANILKKNISAFENVMGRKPQAWETYLVHQQGVAGGPAHLNNPDQPAWKSMYSTSEGKRRGVGWSKRAIWGNIPKDQKRKFGKVENVMSGQFTNLWKARYARADGNLADGAFDPSAASTPAMPERGFTRRVGGSDSDQPVDQGVAMAGGGENPPVPSRRNEMAGDSPQTPGHRPKYQYRAAEYESANDIGAGGPPPPERNPQDPPEAPRAAILPGSSDVSSTRSRMADPVGAGSDNWAGKAFGGSFGELYARPDQGSSLLKDVLPSGRPSMGNHGVPQRPPMFRDFFRSLFGGGG